MAAVASRLKKLPPIVWIAFYLGLLDLGANIVFRYPSDPRDIRPTRTQQYFEYGRSTEGKYARMTRRTGPESAPIVSSGWLHDNPSFVSPQGKGGTDHTVTVYGMSHAGLLAQDMARLDPTLTVRYVGAPGAVPTWSYSAYLLDRSQTRSSAAILAVMTEGIPMLGTTTGSTMFFEFAYPYTYPRFLREGEALVPVWPPFTS